MRSRTILYIALLVVVVVGGILVYRYYSDRQTESPSPADAGQSRDSPATQTPEPATPTTPKSYDVKVYFSKHPESDDDPSKVFAVARTSPDIGVGKFAIAELLRGPTDAEEAAGYFSAARVRSGESTCGEQDFVLTIKDSVATLQFCRRFDHIGTMTDGQADSTLKATLLQFDSVKKVIILNPEGNCEFDLSGMNLCKQ